MGLLDMFNADPSSPQGMRLQGLLGGLSQMGLGMAQAGQMRPMGSPGPSMGDAFASFGTGRRAGLLNAMQTRDAQRASSRDDAWRDAASGSPTTPEGRQLFNAIPERSRAGIFAMGPEQGLKAWSAILSQRPTAASPGQTVFGADGTEKVLPFTPEYIAMKERLAQAGRSSTSVNVNNPPQMGAIPQDHRAVYDANGRVLNFEVIPGSKTDRDVALTASREVAATSGVRRQGKIVLEDIGRIEAVAKEAFLPVAGLGATALSSIPGTAAANTMMLLEGIKANIGFDKLSEMRKESATGGALGQVTVREIELLQATFGSLSQAQSSEQFNKTLGRLKTQYVDMLSKLPPEAAARLGATGQGGAAPPLPPGFQRVPR